MHKSRLGNVIIDCQTDNLAREAEFWSKALGGTAQQAGNEGRYIDVRTNAAEPQVILQRVEHPSWVHIDIETDNIVAEVTRLQNLGASVVEKMERWTVMEAPSKHRFCVVGVRRDGFENKANIWE